MSKAFIAAALQVSTGCTGVAAESIAAIVKEIKKEGSFTLRSFGTFTVAKTKARKGVCLVARACSND